MKVNNEIILKKRNNNILPKIKSELVHKIKKVNKNLESIELYKKFSTRIDSKGKHKKKKKKKLRFVSAVNEVKILNLGEKDKDIDKNKLKIKKFNNNDFIEKKINLKELSQKKRIFSEKVKLIKIYKRNKSPKPREESSFDIRQEIVTTYPFTRTKLLIYGGKSCRENEKLFGIYLIDKMELIKADKDVIIIMEN